MANKEPIRNKIIAQVIGGLILAFLLWVWPAFRDFVISVLVSIWNFIISSARVPWIVLILLGALSLLTIARIITLVFRKNGREQLLKLDNYVRDEFFGVIWQWKYERRGIPDVDSIAAFCPYCKTPLIFPPSDFRFSHFLDRNKEKSVLYCEHCKAIKLQNEKEPYDLIQAINLEVLGTINRGEWKSRLEQQIAAQLEQQISAQKE